MTEEEIKQEFNKMREGELKLEYKAFMETEPEEHYPLDRERDLMVFNTKYAKLYIRDRIPGAIARCVYTIWSLDMNVKMTEENKAIVSKYQGKLEQGDYSPEGYGYPEWSETDYIENSKPWGWQKLKEDRPDLGFLAFKFIAEGQHKLFKTYKTE
jgi:hypothetical protein